MLFHPVKVMWMAFAILFKVRRVQKCCDLDVCSVLTTPKCAVPPSRKIKHLMDGPHELMFTL